VGDLVAYLPRTTRATAATGAVRTTKWDPVLALLAEEPRSLAAEHLAVALSNPLMVALARAVYSDVPGKDPATLLDTTRFATAAAIEEHLIAAFVPAAYQEGPADGRRNWPAERAERWLRYLARGLNRVGQRDLAWWQMAKLVSWYTRLLIGGMLYATFFVLVFHVPIVIAERDDDFRRFLLFDMVTTWLVTLLAFGVIFGVGRGAEPSRTRIGLRGRARQLLRRLGRGFAAGLGVGLPFGAVYALLQGVVQYVIIRGGGWLEIAGIRFGVVAVLAGGLIVGLVFGTVFGLVAAVVAVLSVPVDIAAAVSPASLLAVDRRKTLFSSAVAMSLVLLGFLIAGVATGQVGGGVIGGVIYGLLLAVVVALLMNAWGRWLVLVRFWLPLTGRLPWPVVAFLDDACELGVLRQAGPVYQFRHARLQTYLGAPRR